MMMMMMMIRKPRRVPNGLYRTYLRSAYVCDRSSTWRERPAASYLEPGRKPFPVVFPVAPTRGKRDFRTAARLERRVRKDQFENRGTPVHELSNPVKGRTRFRAHLVRLMMELGGFRQRHDRLRWPFHQTPSHVGTGAR